jgi:hypothetical protein
MDKKQDPFDFNILIGTKKRKKLLFAFSLLSLFGLCMSWLDGEDLIGVLGVWFAFSLPLIIHLIYILIFRD